MQYSRSKKPIRKPKFDQVSKTQVKQMIKSVVASETEYKYFNTALTPATVDFSGTVYNLSAVPQGDTDTSRDGDALRPKSLTLSYQWSYGDNLQTVRVIVFTWYSTSTPVPTSILPYQNGSTIAPLSAYSHDLKPQYKIHYDRMMNLSSVSIPLMTVKCPFIELKGTIQYISGTGVGSNNLYMLVISDSGAAPHPYFAFQSRLDFTDA